VCCALARMPREGSARSRQAGIFDCASPECSVLRTGRFAGAPQAGIFDFALAEGSG